MRPPSAHPRLAFVDIETTGLGAARHRIAEIAVVTVDADGVDEWTTLLDPGRRIATDEEFGFEPGFDALQSARTGLPRFRDIAAELSARLADRLFVAHNARFDYAFVQAEFRRAGIEYSAPALCTMMLSRKLAPDEAEHHLDALIERHELDRVERHRALPDARALHQLWQTLVRITPKRTMERTIGDLLAGPLLPPHLDPAMIDALPERPGVYVLEDADGRALHVARASNLRRHVIGYFRTDRQCARADDLSHRVAAIRFQLVAGPLDARLVELARRRALMPAGGHARLLKRASVVSLRVDPSAVVVAEPVWLADRAPDDDGGLFGLYATERRARNALRKIASRRGVCASMLGLSSDRCSLCNNATECSQGTVCADQRKQSLARLFTAIAPLKLPTWPYRGPIAIREGRTVHVFDRWRHLGSVRSAADVDALFDQRATPFDPEVYVALMQSLPRIAGRSIKVLMRKPRRARSVDDDAQHDDGPHREDAYA